jgi:hypothetical protein
VSKTYDGEKTASSTSLAEKTGYLCAENLIKIYVCHPVQVSTQSGLRTQNFEVSAGKGGSMLELTGRGNDFLNRA